MMKKISKKQLILALIVLFLCVIIALIISLYIFVEVPGYYTIGTTPIVDFDIEKNDNHYILYVNYCYDPDEVSELRDVVVAIHNETDYIVEHMPLHYILNNVSGPITFYDHDDNGMLSVGDEFMIDRDIVTQEVHFIGRYRANGNRMFDKPLS